MSSSLVIDVCTVSFNDECHVEAALERLREKNPLIEFNVTLVNNSEKEFEKIIQPACVAILEGPQRTQKCTRNLGVSWLHGEALNLAFEKTQARYVLVMDPDFYVVKRDAVSDAIDYMKIHGLSIFGVPWHPKWWMKPRGRVAPHFILFDTERLDKKAVNFTPRIQYVNQRGVLRRLGDYLFGRYFFSRFKIGRDEDTASKIQLKTIAATGGMFLLDPYVSDRDIKLSVFSQFLDRVLPDSLSFFPAKWERVSDRSFQVFELSVNNYEGFLWGGMVFGIHSRGHPKRHHRDKIKEVNEIKYLLSYFDKNSQDDS